MNVVGRTTVGRGLSIAGPGAATGDSRPFSDKSVTPNRSVRNGLADKAGTALACWPSSKIRNSTIGQNGTRKRLFMRRTVTAILLMYAAASAQGQSSNPTPPPELKKWNVWTGDWALSGIAKDGPDGPELHSLEILSYDPVRKIHTVSGFSSDGSTWSLTATFHNAMLIENGQSRGPDGQLTRCQTTWIFSNDRMALSGTQECEENGVRWKAIAVRGTKSKVTK